MLTRIEKYTVQDVMAEEEEKDNNDGLVDEIELARNIFEIDIKLTEKQFFSSYVEHTRKKKVIEEVK